MNWRKKNNKQPDQDFRCPAEMRTLANGGMYLSKCSRTDPHKPTHGHTFLILGNRVNVFPIGATPKTAVRPKS